MRRVIVLLLLLAAPAAAQRPAASFSVAPEFAVSVHRVVDVDGDGRSELFVCGRAGEVRVYRTGEDGRWEADPKGELVLPAPDRTLIALSRWRGEGSALELVTLGPAGAVAYPLADDGGFAAKGSVIARRARFRLRSGQPLFSSIVQDTNGDGRPDLVVPRGDACELWLNDGEGFKKTARIEVKVEVLTSESSRVSSDDLYSALMIPDLDIRDVNGDGRSDLVVRRSREMRFHRQRPDGTIPFDPDVVLDLEKFRDTTPPASVRPGYTLAGTEKARATMRDIDGDEIPDFVIAHRRKVWVFHGAPDGPQFTRPTAILKTADDVTALWLAHLDDDENVDLLLFRIQVPTIGTLLTGLLGSFSVEIRAIGYRNEGGRRFGKEPSWRREITFNLPSLGEVIRDPDAIIRRFEDAGRKFRRSLKADFDGDGHADLALLGEDEKRLDVWRGEPGTELEEGADLDRLLRSILFEDDDAEWDLDRLLEWIEELGTQEFRRLTRSKPADAAFSLRPPATHRVVAMEEGDIDRDGRREIVIAYESTAAPGMRVFDVLRVIGGASPR